MSIRPNYSVWTMPPINYCNHYARSLLRAISTSNKTQGMQSALRHGKPAFILRNKSRFSEWNFSLDQTQIFTWHMLYASWNSSNIICILFNLCCMRLVWDEGDNGRPETTLFLSPFVHLKPITGLSILSYNGNRMFLKNSAHTLHCSPFLSLFLGKYCIFYTMLWTFVVQGHKHWLPSILWRNGTENEIPWIPTYSGSSVFICLISAIPCNLHFKTEIRS